jgi:hypothetical protein
MSILPKPAAIRATIRIFVAGAALGLLATPPGLRAEERVPVVHPLPDVRVRALDSSEDVRLARALAGRPAVVLLAEAGGAADPALLQTAADLQQEYGPWFSWVAVLSGPFAAADVEGIRAASSLRIERLYHDGGGALRAGLGVAHLPALLLVDEDGALHQVCSGAGTVEQFKGVAASLRSLAAGSRRRQAGCEDFRLPLVGGDGGLVSFLDIAGRETTIIAFVHTSCLPCARELQVLDYGRDRNAGRTTFVTVFIDTAPDSRIRGFVAAAGVTPDVLLRDPEMHLASRYGIDSVPSVRVVDSAGRIALARNGYRDEDRDGLYRELQGALAAGAVSAAGGGEAALGEARRIHEEACSYLREGRPQYALMFLERVREMLPDYPSVNLRIAEAALAIGDRDLAVRSLARYLAAEPQTYDSSQIRGVIAGLLAPAP